EIKNDNTDVDDTIDVVVSKGSEIIDFTDKEKLQNTRFIDMQVLLNERELQYTVSDIYNNEIKSGYIIGVNKNNSGESGPLVFTVSQGTGASTKKMPYLENKPINEVRDLLEANELLLGGISYIRSDVVKENYVISQSIKGGEAVNAGTKVDLYLSCGVDGVEYIDSSNVKWHGEISKTYNVGSSDTPDVTIEGDSLVLQVRLMQTTSRGIMYTELMEPTEYKKGTILPIIFKDIEGEANVETGSVQVVDVVNDKILFTVPIQFHP
ncbi:MAG: PASTA domain-containing protein, partial [Lachnospiraceae bacterium]|nr:PASTA domain-containing protein [Lachnospiraceae bacterium]